MYPVFLKGRFMCWSGHGLLCSRWLWAIFSENLCQRLFWEMRKLCNKSEPWYFVWKLPVNDVKQKTLPHIITSVYTLNRKSVKILKFSVMKLIDTNQLYSWFVSVPILCQPVLFPAHDALLCKTIKIIILIVKTFS